MRRSGPPPAPEDLREMWHQAIQHRSNAPNHWALGGTSPPRPRKARVKPSYRSPTLSYGRSPDMEIKASVRMTPIRTLATRNAENTLKAAPPPPEARTLSQALPLVLPQSRLSQPHPSEWHLSHNHHMTQTTSLPNLMPGGRTRIPVQNTSVASPLSFQLPPAESLLARAAARRVKTSNRRRFELRWAGGSGGDDDDEEMVAASAAYAYGYSVDTIDITKPSLAQITQQ